MPASVIFWSRSGRTGHDNIADIEISVMADLNASMTDLTDAYGEPFDPHPTIARWQSGENEVAAQVLWQRLYHQGSVGSASFAAAPGLVGLLATSHHPDWNAYALLASIEEARTTGGAEIPPDLKSDYAIAWKNLLRMALHHLQGAAKDEMVRSLLAVIAHAKGQHTLAAIALCTEDEREEMLG